MGIMPGPGIAVRAGPAIQLVGHELSVELAATPSTATDLE
jgi:hypothetical protein